MCLYMNKFIVSVVFFVSLSSLLQAQNEQVQLADSLIKKSQDFAQSFQHDSALYYQEKALPLYEQAGLMEKYYLTQTQMAYSLAKSQRIQPALDLLAQVEEKAKADPSLNILAEVKRNEAIVYETTGNFGKAISLYNAAFEAFQDKNTKESKNELASLHLGVGVSYAMSGRLPEAEKQWGEVIHIYDSLQQRGFRYYAVLNNLGTLTLQMGIMEKSLDYFDQALKIHQSLHNDLNHPQLILLYYNMSNAYSTLTLHDQALDYAIRANNILSAINPKHPQLLSIYGTLSEIYGAKKDWENCMLYGEKQLSLAREAFGENNYWTALGYSTLGNYHLDRLEYKKATELLEKAMSIVATGVEVQDYDYVPKLHINLGMSQVRLGELEDGRTNLEQGFDLFKQYGQAKSNKLSEVYLKAGASFSDQGDLATCLEMVQSSLIAITPSFNDEDPGKNPGLEGAINQKTLMLAFFEKAITLEQLHAKTEDQSMLRNIIEIADLTKELVNELSIQPTTYADKFDWQSKKEGFNEAVISAAVQLYALTKEEDLLDIIFRVMDLDKSSLMVTNIAQNQTLKNLGISDSLQRKRSLYAKNIAYLESQIFQEGQKGEDQDSAKMDFFEEELFDARLQRDQLNQYLRENYPNYYQYGFQPGNVNLAETQAGLLEEGDILLNYFFTDNLLIVLSVAQDEVKVYSSIIDASFHEKVEGFTALCQDRLAKADAFLAASKELKDVLWLDDAIASANRLIIIPDGKLSLVPFEAIALSEGEVRDFSEVDYLVKSHSIVYANSVSSLNIQLGRDQNLNNKVLAFVPSFGANTTAGSGDAVRANLADLTWTKTEVENLSNYFSTESYFDSDATEQTFKEKASDYKIVHIATHGLMDDQAPLFSKLVFSPESKDSLNDGFINTRELFAMDIPAQLVVLSACETGSGIEASGEGIVSLANGFFFAGSKSVVMTLWQANDQSSAEVMDKFYEKLADGSGKADALRQAKLQYLQQADGLRANPYYWAHFVINGDPRPLQSEASSAYIWFILLVPLAFVFIRNAQNKKREEV